jgi:hypothetical protein
MGGQKALLVFVVITGLIILVFNLSLLVLLLPSFHSPTPSSTSTITGNNHRHQAPSMQEASDDQEHTIDPDHHVNGPGDPETDHDPPVRPIPPLPPTPVSKLPLAPKTPRPRPQRPAPVPPIIDPPVAIPRPSPGLRPPLPPVRPSPILNIPLTPHGPLHAPSPPQQQQQQLQSPSPDHIARESLIPKPPVTMPPVLQGPKDGGVSDSSKAWSAPASNTCDQAFGNGFSEARSFCNSGPGVYPPPSSRSMIF